MKVISYNLNKHKAVGELEALAASTTADIVCLQEAVTAELPAQIGSLDLALRTENNRLGLAIYYRRNLFTTLSSRTIALKKSLHDIVLKPAEERVLAVRLHDIDNNRNFIVASFHAAPLTALNSLRRKQIASALTELSRASSALPVLMVGDYNYPVFKENLGQKVREAGYELTLSDSRTYTRYKFFRGHYDFATSVGFDISDITTLPQGRSDHLPILVTAEPV